MSVRLNPETDFAALMAEVGDAKADTVTLNRQLLSEFINEYKNLRETAVTLNTKYTGAKVCSKTELYTNHSQRSSQQYSEGLTIAGEEYDKEVSKRLDLESEVFRLRAQVHNQTARLSLISSDERRAENLRRRSQDLNNSLTGLERDISRLRAQRDISLAEVEELQNKNKNVGGSVEETTSKIGRSLTRRLETIKEQYKDELGPLAAQREVLEREINGLKDFRDELLEAATARAAENDALVELGLQLSKDLEAKQEMLARAVPFPNLKTSSGRGHPSGSPSISSLSSTPLQEVPEEATARVVKVVTRPEIVEAAPARRFKWMGGGKTKPADGSARSRDADNNRDRKVRPSTEMGVREHQFQQHSTMRLGRCELCQDKMWGLQEVKCACAWELIRYTGSALLTTPPACGLVCHSKCADKLPKSCYPKALDDGPMRECAVFIVTDPPQRHPCLAATLSSRQSRTASLFPTLSQSASTPSRPTAWSTRVSTANLVATRRPRTLRTCSSAGGTTRLTSTTRRHSTTLAQSRQSSRRTSATCPSRS
jgi:hypothetical protein